MATKFPNCGGEARFIDGRWWYSEPDNQDWIFIRYVRKPTTNWQRFWYHINHGMLVRYPLPKVLLYAINNCKG